MDEAEKLMDKCSLYIVKVPYRPSLFERLGGSAGIGLTTCEVSEDFEDHQLNLSSSTYHRKHLDRGKNNCRLLVVK